MHKNIFTSCTRKAEEEYYKGRIVKKKLQQIFGGLINPKRVKATSLLQTCIIV